MRLCAPHTILLCVFLFIRIGFAVYADEAYQVDYHHALLGPPQAHTTFFHRPSANSKASLLYTLSESLILGAANPKDGAVLWRQRLADPARNSTSAGLLKAGAGANTIVSAVDRVVQAWDAVDGRLAWIWQGEGKIKALEVIAGDQGENDVLVLSEEGPNSVVRRLAAYTGDVVWEHRDTRYSEAANIGFYLVANQSQWGSTIFGDFFQGHYILHIPTFSAAERAQDQGYWINSFNWEASRITHSVQFRERYFIRRFDPVRRFNLWCSIALVDRQSFENHQICYNR